MSSTSHSLSRVMTSLLVSPTTISILSHISLVFLYTRRLIPVPYKNICRAHLSLGEYYVGSLGDSASRPPAPESSFVLHSLHAIKRVTSPSTMFQVRSSLYIYMSLVILRLAECSNIRRYSVESSVISLYTCILFLFHHEKV